MRRNWRETLLLVLTCAVLFGSGGYFLGARNHGAVYEISGGSSSERYEVPAALSEPLEETTGPDRINLNTATAEELAELPGIGAVKAAAVVAYREENGPFLAVEDLLLVSGIGEATLDGLIDLVTVEETGGKE